MRSMKRVHQSVSLTVFSRCCSSTGGCTEPSHGAAQRPSSAGEDSDGLLGYSLRRVASSEMLYGGVRIRHLVQPAFPLKRIQSELLPSPSLQRERDDLQLEMQMPKHKDPTQLPSYAIQRQVGNKYDVPVSSEERSFDLSQFYNDVHPPSLHHNSSLPYDSNHDNNNVLALRMFPVNIGIRDRTEAIRLRTQDCLHRVQQWRLTSRLGLPVMFPLPQNVQYRIKKRLMEMEVAHTPRSLWSGSLDPNKRHTSETLPLHSSGDAASYLPHLRSRLQFHPPPASLSILTQPEDTMASLPVSLKGCTHQFKPSTRSWMPFQMLKPMGYNWSPSRRSSGVRGPSSQLNQERLDQKGFGWKRKSRHLWQQDIDTAGFRPHRFF